MKQQLLKGAARAADYACLAIGAIVMVFPFVWMILSAFKTPGEIYASPPVWIPSSFRPDNFVSALPPVLRQLHRGDGVHRGPDGGDHHSGGLCLLQAAFSGAEADVRVSDYPDDGPL